MEQPDRPEDRRMPCPPTVNAAAVPAKKTPAKKAPAKKTPERPPRRRCRAEEGTAQEGTGEEGARQEGSGEKGPAKKIAPPQPAADVTRAAEEVAAQAKSRWLPPALAVTAPAPASREESRSARLPLAAAAVTGILALVVVLLAARRNHD